MVTIKKDMTIYCLQHPNGECFITADNFLASKFEILDQKTIHVKFLIDPGYDENRAYPSGKID